MVLPNKGGDVAPASVWSSKGANVDHQQQFSFTGAGVTLIGQTIVLPAEWSPAVKAVVAFGCSLFVGLIAPLLRDVVRNAIAEWVGRKRAETQRDEAKAALADSQAELRRLREGLTLLGPPSHQMVQSPQSAHSGTPEK